MRRGGSFSRTMQRASGRSKRSAQPAATSTAVLSQRLPAPRTRLSLANDRPRSHTLSRTPAFRSRVADRGSQRRKSECRACEREAPGSCAPRSLLQHVHAAPSSNLRCSNEVFCALPTQTHAIRPLTSTTAREEAGNLPSLCEFFCFLIVDFRHDAIAFHRFFQRPCFCPAQFYLFSCPACCVVVCSMRPRGVVWLTVRLL